MTYFWGRYTYQRRCETLWEVRFWFCQIWFLPLDFHHTCIWCIVSRMAAVLCNNVYCHTACIRKSHLSTLYLPNNHSNPRQFGRIYWIWQGWYPWILFLFSWCKGNKIFLKIVRFNRLNNANKYVFNWDECYLIVIHGKRTSNKSLKMLTKPSKWNQQNYITAKHLFVYSIRLDVNRFILLTLCSI